MNLEKLFEMQKELDEDILNHHPELKGEDLLPKKILALQVELAECAQCWRGFKFWSKDQEPRTLEMFVEEVNGHRWGSSKNPLLEEYVDCLHFLLSVGLEQEFEDREFACLNEHNFGIYTERDSIEQFTNTFKAINDFIDDDDVEAYEEILLYFVGLSRHLGFTWEEVEQAYDAKNATNHERQESGY